MSFDSSIDSLLVRPPTVFSKLSTPAPASRKVLSASLICLLIVRMFLEKLSLSSDSDTTSSRKVSAMESHLTCF